MKPDRRTSRMARGGSLSPATPNNNGEGARVEVVLNRKLRRRIDALVKAAVRRP